MSRETRPLHPLVALGGLGEWRWAVTGVGALLVTTVVAAVCGRKQS